jgi:hypothetical protein
MKTNLPPSASPLVLEPERQCPRGFVNPKAGLIPAARPTLTFRPVYLSCCAAGLAYSLLFLTPASGGTIVAGPGDAGLRTALQGAQDGDAIAVNSQVQLLSSLRLDKRVTIQSGNPPSPVTIQANFEGEMFQIAAGGVTFERLALEGSFQTDGFRAEKDVILRDCTLQHARQPVLDNFSVSPPPVVRLERTTVAHNGEALGCVSLQAKDSQFSFNGTGGASVRDAYLDGCVFDNNQGAGVAVNFGTVKNCVFRLNGGFGLFFDPDPGILSLSSSLFHENAGGGLLLGEEGVATVDNCTITLQNGPPAVVIREVHEALFRHCTVSGNKYVTGSGLPGYPGGGSFAIGTSERVELQNCLVADNSTNAVDHVSGLVGTWTDGGGNVTSGSAKLGALASNGGPTQTLLPQAGSPAINAGKPSDLVVDARGLSRLAGAKPDAGAVETGAGPPADQDADGLPDIWETFHGLNPNNKPDAVSDADGDGRNALEEFRSGTNPADPKSFLRIEDFEPGPIPVEPPNPGVRFTWGYASGVMYRVEISSDLVHWRDSSGTIHPNGRQEGRQMLVFEGQAASLPSFYRVVVVKSPFE